MSSQFTVVLGRVSEEGGTGEHGGGGGSEGDAWGKFDRLEKNFIILFLSYNEIEGVTDVQAVITDGHESEPVSETWILVKIQPVISVKFSLISLHDSEPLVAWEAVSDVLLIRKIVLVSGTIEHGIIIVIDPVDLGLSLVEHRFVLTYTIVVSVGLDVGTSHPPFLWAEVNPHILVVEFRAVHTNFISSTVVVVYLHTDSEAVVVLEQGVGATFVFIPDIG